MTDGLESWIGGAAVSSLDADERTIRLKAPSDQLHLGDVPPGWIITIVFPRMSRDRRLTVERVGVGVEWIITGNRRDKTWLPENIDKVRAVAGSQGEAVSLALVRSGCTIVAEAGTIAVHGPEFTYDLKVELANDQEALNVQGDAVLSSIEGGPGTVTVDSSIAPGTRVEGFTRTITIRTDLNAATVDVPEARLEVAGVIRSQSSVRAGELFAHRIEDSTAEAERGICAAGPVLGSTLTVHQASPGPAALWISGPHQNRPADVPMSLDVRTPPFKAFDTTTWVVAVAPGTEVSDSTLTCTGQGDIAVAGDVFGSTLRTAGSAVITGRAELRPAADDAPSLDIGGSTVVCGETALNGCDVVVGGSFALAAIRGDGSVQAETLSVSGNVESVRLSASQATFAGVVENAAVHARDFLHLSGEVAASATVRLDGEGIIEGTVAGTLDWRPTTATELFATPLCRAVSATATGDGATSTILWGDSEVALEELTVAGEVALRANRQSEAHGPSWFKIGKAHLTPDSTLRIASETSSNMAFLNCGTGSSLVLEPGSIAELGALGSGRLIADVPTGAVLTVTGDDAAGPGQVSVIGGGTVNIGCVVDDLECVLEGSPDDGSPLLSVTKDGQVLCLRGDVRLGVVAGIVVGKRSERKNWWQPRSGPKDDASAPRIRGLEPEADGQVGASSSGMVTSVDPTVIPYGQLNNAHQYQVFEPDTVAMISYRPSTRKDSSHRHDSRRAAYQTQRIAELVAASSASGGARTAASWAAARAHHRALQHAPVERILRTIHRSFGYSQRPGPPLFTYLLVLAAWTAAHLRYYEPKGQPHGGTLWTAWHIGLLPASFIARIPEGDTPAFPPVLGNFTANVLAFLTLGLPLVFAFIALRHFMAAPTRK